MEEKDYILLENTIEIGILKCLEENPDIEKEIPWFTIKANNEELELA